MISTTTSISIQPIGYIRSCYREKFGIPRQPNLVKEARAELHLVASRFSLESTRGLEKFSHIWLIFVFHATQAQGWHPTVRPPRLGGEQRLGVFATRSMFRPNPLGLSVVKLEQIKLVGAEVVLCLTGIDLLDGTPVLDIKPYLPYADCVVEASAGFAAKAPEQKMVSFSALALHQCQQKTVQWQQDIQTLIEQIVAQDPRPAYRVGAADSRYYAMKLYDFDVRWHYTPQGIEVLELVSI